MKGQGLKDERTINESIICISANVLRKLLRGFLSTQQPGMIFAQHQQDMLPLFPTLSTSQDGAQSWPVLNTLLHAEVPGLPFFSWPVILLIQSFRTPQLSPNRPTSGVIPYSFACIRVCTSSFAVHLLEMTAVPWVGHRPFGSQWIQCLWQCHTGKLYCEWIIALFSEGRLCTNLVPTAHVMHTAYCTLPIFHHTTTNWLLGHTLSTPQPPLLLHLTICL